MNYITNTTDLEQLIVQMGLPHSDIEIGLGMKRRSDEITNIIITITKESTSKCDSDDGCVSMAAIMYAIPIHMFIDAGVMTTEKLDEMKKTHNLSTWILM